MSTFLDVLKRYVHFDAEDSSRLLGLLPVVQPHLRSISDVFYERIDADPEARAVITGGNEQVRRLKRTLSEWLRSGLAGPHDEEWYQLRTRIGRRHVSIGLPQRYMLTAMSVMRSEVQAIIERELPEDVVIETVRSVDRLFDMELAIMLETYKEDTERRLRSNERLAAIGQLAATIGHDLRNPMGVIQSSAFILRRRAQDDERALKHLGRIERQLDVAGSIIEDLLHFVRDSPLCPERVPVCDLLTSAVREWDESASVPIDCEPDLAVEIDAGLVRRALVNMLQNAAQATRGDAAPGIEMRGRRDGADVVLSVLDRGAGFDPLALASAFQPLFTTRAKGTGLGLALVGRVAERHGGSANAANRDGGGAIVSMVLPAGES